MTDHNLDDLIIDNIEPKNRKTKSFLTIIALFIVVLIVAIILTRTLLKTQDNNALVIEDDTTELIAPELKLQEKPQQVEKVEEPTLESIIEEEPPAPEIKIEAPVDIPEAIKVEKKIEVPEPIIPAPVEPPKKEEKIPAPEPVKEIKKEVPLPPVKPVVKKPVAKKPIVKEPVAKKTAVASDLQYYIQVGSFSKDPSARFLSVIKNSGFNYQLTKANVKGIKKLHIGPYNTRPEVDVALKKVKDRINKSAFVIKK
ncbi:SPOR domain-containing protein [Sulfurovum sp.]|uniref:SPOR domain-containing protein n=1 Tax=Sulfurovum sp. TaxID=1969726 RepID=UPI002867FFC3|nr:SPOR domain-containing protein [Sulfurovum sp.]